MGLVVAVAAKRPDLAPFGRQTVGGMVYVPLVYIFDVLYGVFWWPWVRCVCQTLGEHCAC